MRTCMSVRLVPLNGPAIELNGPLTLIGRHEDCDVRIDLRKVSRRHCCIVQLCDHVVLRDLESTNGTYLNGQRVEEAELTSQDQISIADIRYCFVIDASTLQTVQAEKGGVVSPGHTLDAPHRIPQQNE